MTIYDRLLMSSLEGEAMGERHGTSAQQQLECCRNGAPEPPLQQLRPHRRLARSQDGAVVILLILWMLHVVREHNLWEDVQSCAELRGDMRRSKWG